MHYRFVFKKDCFSEDGKTTYKKGAVVKWYDGMTLEQISEAWRNMRSVQIEVGFLRRDSFDVTDYDIVEVTDDGMKLLTETDIRALGLKMWNVVSDPFGRSDITYA